MSWFHLLGCSIINEQCRPLCGIFSNHRRVWRCAGASVCVSFRISVRVRLRWWSCDARYGSILKFERMVCFHGSICYVIHAHFLVCIATENQSNETFGLARCTLYYIRFSRQKQCKQNLDPRSLVRSVVPSVSIRQRGTGVCVVIYRGGIYIYESDSDLIANICEDGSF